MRKLILAILSVPAVALFGQGTIDVGNLSKGAFVQPIFLFNPANPDVEQIGNPSTTSYPGALPTGTLVFGGPTAGSGFDLVFFYTANASATSVTLSSVTNMTIGTTAPLSSAASPTANPAGTINSVPALALTPQSGVNINWVFGAFNTEGGTVTTWAQALAVFNAGDPLMLMGVGTVVTGTTLGGTDTAGGLHPEPNTYGGWSSFSLIPNSPEPSALALAGLGSASLLLFRRRNNCPNQSVTQPRP